MQTDKREVNVSNFTCVLFKSKCHSHGFNNSMVAANLPSNLPIRATDLACSSFTLASSPLTLASSSLSSATTLINSLISCLSMSSSVVGCPLTITNTTTLKYIKTTTELRRYVNFIPDSIMPYRASTGSLMAPVAMAANGGTA